MTVDWWLLVGVVGIRYLEMLLAHVQREYLPPPSSHPHLPVADSSNKYSVPLTATVHMYAVAGREYTGS